MDVVDVRWIAVLAAARDGGGFMSVALRATAAISWGARGHRMQDRAGWSTRGFAARFMLGVAVALVVMGAAVAGGSARGW